MINKKKGIILFMIIILNLSLFLIMLKETNAGFIDVFNKITGRAASESATVTITVGNTAPVIGNVTLDKADNVAITENGNKSFLFSFVVTDQEGAGNIVNNSAVANITRGFGGTAETTRHNNTFVNVNDGGCRANNPVGLNGINYSCTINIVFYDEAGLWNISVRINDSNGNFVQNTTKTFTIAETSSISISPSTISFPTIVPSDQNKSSSVNLSIINIGNDDLSGREATGETINITAVTLVPSSGSTFIPASNFSIGQVNGTSGHNLNFCDTSITANVTRLQNTTVAQGWANFTGAINGSGILARANNNYQSYGLCLLHAPGDLASTTYSTTSSGAWTFLVF